MGYMNDTNDLPQTASEQTDAANEDEATTSGASGGEVNPENAEALAEGAEADEDAADTSDSDTSRGAETNTSSWGTAAEADAASDDV